MVQESYRVSQRRLGRIAPRFQTGREREFSTLVLRAKGFETFYQELLSQILLCVWGTDITNHKKENVTRVIGHLR